MFHKDGPGFKYISSYKIFILPHYIYTYRKKRVEASIGATNQAMFYEVPTNFREVMENIVQCQKCIKCVMKSQMSGEQVSQQGKFDYSTQTKFCRNCCPQCYCTLKSFGNHLRMMVQDDNVIIDNKECIYILGIKMIKNNQKKQSQSPLFAQFKRLYILKKQRDIRCLGYVSICESFVVESYID